MYTVCAKSSYNKSVYSGTICLFKTFICYQQTNEFLNGDLQMQRLDRQSSLSRSCQRESCASRSSQIAQAPSSECMAMPEVQRKLAENSGKLASDSRTLGIIIAEQRRARAEVTYTYTHAEIVYFLSGHAGQVDIVFQR